MAWPPNNRWLRAVVILIVFVIVGPVIGGLVFTSPVLISSLFAAIWSWDTALDTLTALAGVLGVMAMVSLMIGGASAAMCGLWVAYREWSGEPVPTIQAVLAGIVASIPIGLAMSTTSSPFRWDEFLSSTLMMCIFGAIAAGVCLALCRRLGLMSSPA